MSLDEYIATFTPEELELLKWAEEEIERDIARWHERQRQMQEHAKLRQRITAAKKRARIVTRA